MRSSLRAIFETVRDHLLRQGEASKADGKCQYRGDGGTSCAVGCLISDGAYSPSIEGVTMYSLRVSECGWVPALGAAAEAIALADALNSSGLPATQLVQDLMAHLQTIHDEIDPKAWKRALDELGCKWTELQLWDRK